MLLSTSRAHDWASNAASRTTAPVVVAAVVVAAVVVSAVVVAAVVVAAVVVAVVVVVAAAVSTGAGFDWLRHRSTSTAVIAAFVAPTGAGAARAGAGGGGAPLASFSCWRGVVLAGGDGSLGAAARGAGAASSGFDADAAVAGWAGSTCRWATGTSEGPATPESCGGDRPHNGVEHGGSDGGDGAGGRGAQNQRLRDRDAGRERARERSAILAGPLTACVKNKLALPARRARRRVAPVGRRGASFRVSPSPRPSARARCRKASPDDRSRRLA